MSSLVLSSQPMFSALCGRLTSNTLSTALCSAVIQQNVTVCMCAPVCLNSPSLLCSDLKHLMDRNIHSSVKSLTGLAAAPPLSRTADGGIIL